MKTYLEIARLPHLRRRFGAQPFIGAAVPQRDVASAIIAAGNCAFKAAVVERMIFHMHRQALDRGIKRGAVGERPGLEYAIHFKPQVIVETSCAMPLNKKAVAFLFGRLIRGFRSLEKTLFRRYSSSDIAYW